MQQPEAAKPSPALHDQLAQAALCSEPRNLLLSDTSLQPRLAEHEREQPSELQTAAANEATPDHEAQASH